MNILHIDASGSDATTSHSRRLSAELVGKLQAAHPGTTVVYRDVAAHPFPHIDATIRQAWATDGNRDATLSATADRSRQAVEELKAADVLVIGSSMYNFTVPSTLKSWIDHVAIAGQTFAYGENGPKGLLAGKVYLVLSSGGVYSAGPFAAYEHLGSYLTAILGFLGLQDVEVIRAEGVAYGPEQDAAAMTSARSRIEALAAA